MSARPICPVCGDAIGVYEPLLVCEGGLTRITSLAREPGLRVSNDALVHGSCADQTEALASAGA